ncbi:hypothetical protein GALMADRAFT_146913 [Galerina marginata CBS 339.88]|uniref:Protein kinase domain-containing protein n=1 Tax=Galerina marginata (strain CBS 339.88) TaxID=685588 RepID=A0A067SIS5_GALM3|nr:hypothetical protein GALMADRAFT_146913 [Galerina marginata CBS 339.88]
MASIGEQLGNLDDDFFKKVVPWPPALPALDCIFSARIRTTIPSLHDAAVGSIWPDGYNVAKHGGGVLVAKFKHRSAGHNAIAEVELTAYVARADVKFYAHIAIVHQYRLVTLTPALSCIPSASDGRDRKALYRAFAVASVLQIQITARRFPPVTRLRKWGSLTEYLSFQILGFHPDRQNYRLLFLAETTGPEKQTIVVKFAREYSLELHAFCAQRGYAPRILGFERLPGWRNAIATEHVASGVTITSSSGLDTHRNMWTKELLELVDDYHAEGLVHGDLRDVNVIYNNQNVMLLDFDWGDQDGQVRQSDPEEDTCEAYEADMSTMPLSASPYKGTIRPPPPPHTISSSSTYYIRSFESGFFETNACAGIGFSPLVQDLANGMTNSYSDLAMTKN